MLYAGRPFRVRRILVAASGDPWNRWNCDNPDLDPRESTPDLYAALKRHWGYDSFRPMQERIVQSLLGGSDVAVIMPIGGGKSLWFTPGGGQVVARVIPEGDSLFRLEEEHPGVGIAPGEIPRLFQEFRQLSSRKPEQGTGLGLALTRHIVEAQGGRVDVRSVPVPDKAACSRRSCRWRRSRRHRRKASELPKQPTF